LPILFPCQAFCVTPPNTSPSLLDHLDLLFKDVDLVTEVDQDLLA